MSGAEGRNEIRELEEQIAQLRQLADRHELDVGGELRKLEEKLAHMKTESHRNLSPVDRVQLARHPKRPYTLDYVEKAFDDFIELHGDRSLSDDGAIVTGLARFRGRTISVAGHQKGREIRERVGRNHGMAHPEGYRKAMRAMELADRHGFPFVTLVDTLGAFPGVTAEQRGQGGWLARCQLAMARLRSPSIACIIGEGGSGGAVALAVADRVLMQENAIYSVISPEGCAAILWRDAGEAKRAAAALKPDAGHCLDLGVIDGVVPEPANGAHADHDEAARLLGEQLETALVELEAQDPDERRRERHRKFRNMGLYLE
jgi:acetyl-CoA carboxylase carboxyl transferase subunit alpha